MLVAAMRRIQTLFVVTFLLVAAAGGGLGLGAVSAAANEEGGAGNEDGAAGNEPVEDDPANETDAFGQLVSEFVHALQAENDTDGPLGIQVANFVLANNPAAQMGLIPDHAGPPENKTIGPPENKSTGPPPNVTQGAPEDVGPAGNETDESRGNGQGPPEDRGNGSQGGPPEDAGPPDDR